MDEETYDALVTVHGTFPNFDLGIGDVIEDNDSIDDDLLSSCLDVDPNFGPPQAQDVDEHDERVHRFLQGSRAKSTVYKNTSAEKRFNLFCGRLEPPETRRIHQIPLFDLNRIMCEFFMSAEKVDQRSAEKLGVLYQPDSLSSFVHSWQRILTERRSSIDLKRDKVFESSRQCLAARRKQLVQQGLGNKPCATRPISVKEVDRLYAAGYFGTNTPLSLQRHLWWVITTLCGFRGRDESKKLKFGDMVLGIDEETSRSYLEWSVLRGSKTFTGEVANSHSAQRTFNPKVHETGDDKCPVKAYKLFVEHRPVESLAKDSPFFLAMIPEARINSSVWFYNKPLGKNKLGEFLSHAKSILGESFASRSKIANHSARKTSITKLLHNNVHPIHVVQLTGHKNYESLNHYNVVSPDQQREMSSIISGNSIPVASNAPADRSPVPVPFRDRSPLRARYQQQESHTATAASSSSALRYQQIENNTVTTTNDATPLPINSQQQQQENRTVTTTSTTSQNIITSSASEDLIASIFRGATISNNTITINVHPPSSQQAYKRRRVNIIFDSDEE